MGRVTLFSSPAFTHAPIADHLGPFARAELLEVLHHHWPRGKLETLVDTDGAAAAEIVDGVVVGIGHADLVDYRSPFGSSGPALLADLADGRRLRMDSLPAVVAKALAAELGVRGRQAEIIEHDSAAVLALPGTFDDWLMSIGKKERHETRRKRRRYEEAVGRATIERFDAPGDGRLTEFVEMHRRSDGDKGSFMTEAMARFFADVMTLEGWGIDALIGSGGEMTAAGFGYHGRDGYYLYNSAFDRTLSEASPGVVLIAALIEAAMEAGQSTFDFLKGDETYKYRLGAHRRPLFKVEVGK